MRSGRRRRQLIEKLFAGAAHFCQSCGAKWYTYRSLFAAFQRYTQCPSCRNRELTRLDRIDKLDNMSRNPLRRLLTAFGCPLYHCGYCRMQFRDWRGLDPDTPSARLRRQEDGDGVRSPGT